MNSSSFLVLVGCLTGPSAKLPVVRWRREESRGQSSAYHEDSSVTPNHRGQALSGFMISARLAKTYPQTQRMPSGALPIRRDHHTSGPPLSRRTQPNTRTSLQHKRGGAAHPFTRFVPMQYALRRNCHCSAGEGTEAPRALGLAPGPPRCSELPPRVLSTAPSPLRQEGSAVRGPPPSLGPSPSCAGACRPNRPVHSPVLKDTTGLFGRHIPLGFCRLNPES